MKRYTAHQLNAQAKQAFRRIQLNRPDGGAKQNYKYKGWDILISDSHVTQMLLYDVMTPDTEKLKRSLAIPL